MPVVTRRFFKDNVPQQTLSTQINDIVTSLQVPSFTGWPTSFPFFAVLDYATGAEELVLVTDISGTTATVTRARGGTTAISHPAGATFNHCAVAQDYDEANAHHVATSGVHGVTGGMVGTTDVQSLTNKTLISPTLSGIVSGGAVQPASLSVSGAGSVAGALTAGSVIVSGNTALTGDITVGGNEIVNGTLNVTGALGGSSGGFSGALNAASLTASGAITGASVAGIVNPKSYTNEAAAGTGTTGQFVFLSAPTTSGYLPGLFRWSGSAWTPVQQAIVRSGGLVGTPSSTIIPITFTGAGVFSTDGNGDTIILSNTVFNGITGGSVIGASTFNIGATLRLVSSNLAARIWNGGTLVTNSSAALTYVIHGWL